VSNDVTRLSMNCSGHVNLCSHTWCLVH